MTLVEGLAWVNSHHEDIRRWSRDVEMRGGEDDAWRWLFDRVSPFTSMTMKGALELERRMTIEKLRRGQSLSLLVGRAATDPEFVTQLRRVLKSAPLTGARADQLTTALDLMQEGQDHVAVPLLINSLEGMFWTEAAERGLIVRTSSGKWHSLPGPDAPRKQIHGLEQVLDLLGAELDDALRAFLKAVVYGGSGDPFRHGTARDGWQLRAGFLVLALAGWLDMRGLMDSRVAIRGAFARSNEPQSADASSSAA